MNFTHPAFLGALAGLSVPVAVHFLRSRKLNPLPLGTLRFLQSAIAETTRWERIREWLLLLLRMLLVALAAFLFARPFRDGTPAAEAKPGDEWILVLDASASMRVQLSENAERKVPPNAGLGEFKRMLENVPKGVTAVPLLLAEEVEEISDAKAADNALGGPCNFAALAEWLKQRVARNPQVARRVILFSDLQMPVDGMGGDDFRWTEKIPFEIRHTAPPSTNNLAVGTPRERVRLLTGDGGGISFRVPVLRAGDMPRQAIQVTTTEGKSAADAPLGGGHKIEIPPTESSFHLPVVANAPKDIDATVRLLSGDAWPLDDERCFSLRATGRVPVLLVDGDPGLKVKPGQDTYLSPPGSTFATDIYFLRQALQATERDEMPSPFEVTACSEKFEALEEKPWRTIALCNVGSVNEESLAALTEQVKAGCGLVIFLGDKTSLADWERVHAAGLSPAEIKISAQPGVLRPLATWDTSHPALAEFSERAEGDFSHILLRDHYELKAGADAAVLATVGEGKPVLLTKMLGKGQIVLFGNPADRDWTDFPMQRLYLPFVDSLFHYAAQMTGSGEQGMLPERAVALGDGRLPGRYDDVILHVAEEESCAGFLGEAAFRELLHLGMAPTSTSEPTPADAARTGEWWSWLAFALLVGMLAETFLADHSRVKKFTASRAKEATDRL